jgi:hypothetical protein
MSCRAGNICCAPIVNKAGLDILSGDATDLLRALRTDLGDGPGFRMLIGRKGECGGGHEYSGGALSYD